MNTEIVPITHEVLNRFRNPNQKRIYSHSRESQRYAKVLETPEDEKHIEIIDQRKSIVRHLDTTNELDDTMVRGDLSNSKLEIHSHKSSESKRMSFNHYDERMDTQPVVYLNENDDFEDDYIREDEEIAITPSSSHDVEHDYQLALNQQTSEFERPKR